MIGDWDLVRLSRLLNMYYYSRITIIHLVLSTLSSSHSQSLINHLTIAISFVLYVIPVVRQIHSISLWVRVKLIVRVSRRAKDAAWD